ncbi:MAG TPA: KilA-N domain-containing protein, partial [Methylophaga aminisulfidivorans]|nr:KilA-N domain-containing protein [Methylophaga aminisulfidivorans]
MSSLVVADTQVNTDSEGRYCLNDLHKAAGGLSQHQPAKYFSNQQAQNLISEIGEHAVTRIRGRGKAQGTYVVEELVYAYAMWISPSFNLKVLRAYKQLQTQGIAVADHAAADLLANPLVYLERVLEQAKQLEAANRIAVAERNVAVNTIAKVSRTLKEVG